jgi:hypothetical protein
LMNHAGIVEIIITGCEVWGIGLHGIDCRYE